MKGASANVKPLARRRFVAGIFLLGVFAMLLHVASLRYPLLLDDRQVLDNPDIRDPNRFLSLWTHGYWEGIRGHPVAVDLYRPLTMASFNLSFRLGGNDPASYRLVNFVLHGLTAVLVAMLAARLTRSPLAGLVAGALHAALPVHAETVIGIIYRSELLAAALAVGAALAHVAALERGRVPWLGAALFAAGMLAKESVLALPAALVLLDRVTLPAPAWNLRRQALRRYGPYCAALLLTLGMRFAVLGRFGVAEGRYFESESTLQVWLTMATFAALHYVRPLVLGWPLVSDFSRESFPTSHADDIPAWIALLALVGVAITSAVLAWRRRSLSAAGLACAFVLLLPVSNVVFRIGILGAHRALYLPAIGWCLAIAAVISRTSRTGERRALIVAAAVMVVAFYGAMAVARGDVRESRQRFFAEILSQAPENTVALQSLAALALEEGRFEDAELLLRRALAVNPNLFTAGSDLVSVLGVLRRFDEALAVSERLQPGDDAERAALHDGRAAILGNRALPGDVERALSEARQAVALDPMNVSYRMNVAAALAALGKPEAAAAELREALALPVRNASALETRRAIEGMLEALEGANRRNDVPSAPP